MQRLKKFWKNQVVINGGCTVRSQRCSVPVED